MAIKQKWKGVEFNFLSFSVLFLFSLGHKVLDSNNLKQNCLKLARARHFPTSTFQPWNCLRSKSPLSRLLSSSLLQAPGFLCALDSVPQTVWTRPVLCEGFTVRTGYKWWYRNCRGGMFQLRHPVDGLWEAKSWVIGPGWGSGGCVGEAADNVSEHLGLILTPQEV